MVNLKSNLSRQNVNFDVKLMKMGSGAESGLSLGGKWFSNYNSSNDGYLVNLDCLLIFIKFGPTVALVFFEYLAKPNFATMGLSYKKSVILFLLVLIC